MGTCCSSNNTVNNPKDTNDSMNPENAQLTPEYIKQPGRKSDTSTNYSSEIKLEHITLENMGQEDILVVEELQLSRYGSENSCNSFRLGMDGYSSLDSLVPEESSLATSVQSDSLFDIDMELGDVGECLDDDNYVNSTVCNLTTPISLYKLNPDWEQEKIGEEPLSQPLSEVLRCLNKMQLDGQLDSKLVDETM